MMWDHPSMGRNPDTGVSLIYEAPWVASNTVYSTYVKLHSALTSPLSPSLPLPR